jgi:lysophospholipase L1-like esterase
MNVMQCAGSTSRTLLGLMLAAALLLACSGDDKYKKVVVVGDSLGEGYQTAVAFYLTQPNSFANRMAYKVLKDADDKFELPLLNLPLSVLLDPIGGRRRIDPELETPNLSVGGADVHDIVATQATATSPSAIRTEFDRVLFPRTGTQVAAAVAEDPDLIVLWIGSNDALGAATSPGFINGRFGLTPVDSFRTDFTQALDQLSGTGADVVVGNIPPVTAIAYLLPGPVLGLPPTVRIPLPVALGIAGGTLPPETLQNPDFLLDAAEAAAIDAHINQLNQVIDQVAAAHDAAVVDINGYYRSFLQTQPVSISKAGLPTFRISTDYAPRFSATSTGGVFSLDGVHPSNTGYALAANQFIQVINQAFDKDFDEVDVWDIASRDPYVDKDGDGCISGPGFVSIPGVTGDSNDSNPTVFECSAAGKPQGRSDPIRLPMTSPLRPGAWDSILRR